MIYIIKQTRWRDTIGAEYAKLFPNHTGMPAKPVHITLGSLLIQK